VICLQNTHAAFAITAIVALMINLQDAVAPPASNAPPEQVFIFPYFQSNGETGIFLALSRDGLNLEPVNDNRPILPAPQWRGNGLTRDPSILFHDGTFHMVWTTDWGSRSIGYAQSKDLVKWSEPRRIDLWGGAAGVVNTWAPELHWDPQAQEFFILFSSTLKAELEDGDGSEEPANLDHRIYAVRTRDFQEFTQPALFYSPMEPEHSVIDAFVAPDDRGTVDVTDDRWVMVVKNELAPERGGKNLRLAFAERAQGPYETTLSEPIAGQGSAIIDQMAEGPSLLKVDGLWRLYFDAPGSREPYSLATSPDLVTWTNRSGELRMPVEHPRHGTVARVPTEAVGWLKQPRAE